MVERLERHGHRHLASGVIQGRTVAALSTLYVPPASNVERFTCPFCLKQGPFWNRETSALQHTTVDFGMGRNSLRPCAKLLPHAQGIGQFYRDGQDNRYSKTQKGGVGKTPQPINLGLGSGKYGVVSSLVDADPPR